MRRGNKMCKGPVVGRSEQAQWTQRRCWCPVGWSPSQCTGLFKGPLILQFSLSSLDGRDMLRQQKAGWISIYGGLQKWGDQRPGREECEVREWGRAEAGDRPRLATVVFLQERSRPWRTYQKLPSVEAFKVGSSHVSPVLVLSTSSRHKHPSSTYSSCASVLHAVSHTQKRNRTSPS